MLKISSWPMIMPAIWARSGWFSHGDPAPVDQRGPDGRRNFAEVIGDIGRAHERDHREGHR